MRNSAMWTATRCVDACETEYQKLIRSDRPQRPAGLLAALGVLDGPDLDETDPDDELDIDAAISETMLDGLRRAIGGDAALDALDAGPLPDEPFDWGAVPADVHARLDEVLDLVDRRCVELLDTE